MEYHISEGGDDLFIINFFLLKKVVKPNSRTPQIKFRYGGSKRGDVLTGVRAANQGGKDELISQVKQQVKPKAPKTPVGAGFHARDGSGSMNELLHNTPIVAAKAKAPPLPSKPLPVTKLPTIEDWQLQPRFRRKPLKPIEIEYINVRKI